MAEFDKEDKDGRGTSARPADWEVVSLTASAYAAAPGPIGSDPADVINDKEFNKNEDYARAMFMSGHFVFPPSEHENLPIVPGDVEFLNKSEVQDIDMVEVEMEVPENPLEEIWNKESQSGGKDIDIQSAQFFGKGKSEKICAGNVEHAEGKKTVDDLSLVNEVGNLYMDPGFNSFHMGTLVGGTVPVDEIADVTESEDQINQVQGCSPKSNDKSKYNVSKAPTDSWWKKQVSSFYAQAKEASTVWSLCVAAALLGLVVLGQRWHRERWQIHPFTSQLSFNDEKLSKLLSPAIRLKDVVARDHRRAIALQAGSSAAV